jgi:hypothetical protein
MSPAEWLINATARKVQLEFPRILTCPAHEILGNPQWIEERLSSKPWLELICCAFEFISILIM